MPSHLKSRVRARMAKTGERWEQALRVVRAADADAAPTPRPYTRTPSRARSVADTAFSIAVVRAEEALLPEGERLFDDPFAAIFAAAGAHAAESTQRFLDLPFFRDGIRLLPAPPPDGTVARAACRERCGSHGREHDVRHEAQALHHNVPCVMTHGKSLSIR